MSVSSIRVSLSEASEKALNQQFNLEFYASYVYQSIMSFASQSNVALSGLELYARKMSDEERAHGIKLIDYINMRGGKVQFEAIQAPPSRWTDALQVMESVLELEISVYKSLLTLHKIASDSSDPQLTDFIEGDYLKDQVKDIKKVGDLISKLKRAGPEGLGLVYWDHELLERC